MIWEQFINTIPDKKQKKNFFNPYARTEWGKKRLQRAALEVWEKLPLEINNCSNFKFKNMYKQPILKGYN